MFMRVKENLRQAVELKVRPAARDMTARTHLPGNTRRDNDNLGSFKSIVKLVSCVASNLARGHKLKLRHE